MVELLELAADEHEKIGGHTDRHPILARCTDEEAREEIVGGGEKFQQLLGHAPRWFAYPNGGIGGFDVRKSAQCLQEAGEEGAFSMIYGRVRADHQPWNLPCCGAPRSAREAEATVSGAFEVVKEWKQHFRRRAAL